MNPNSNHLVVGVGIDFGHVEAGSGAEVLPPEHRGEVIGFRCWTLRGHRLGSLTGYGDGWDLGANRAECKAGWGGPATKHAAPHPNCLCGLYAWHEVTSLPLTGEGLRIYGAVVMWGEIEVYWDGLRAEWAEPVVLSLHPFAPTEFRERVGAVASEFGVPLVALEQLEAEAKRHGSSAKELAPEMPEISFDLKLEFDRGPYSRALHPHPVATGGLIPVPTRFGP